MDINELTLESLKRYFQVLKRTGNVDGSQVNKLLVLSFIDELLHDEYSWFITEDDYAILTNLINCISKSSCIVPYNNVAIHTEPIKNYLEDTPTRVSENVIIRLATEDVLRLANL